MLSYFYHNTYTEGAEEIELDETNSSHMIQVLRMKENERLHLTNGKGNLLTCTIIQPHKKHSRVRVDEAVFVPPTGKHLTIGISILKNNARFEWFLEKATEIGINEIMPLVSERTIREKFRYERMQQICISAMLQSQQSWLPLLHTPLPMETALADVKASCKFIAHCYPGTDKKSLAGYAPFMDAAVFIGPEGDFTKGEISSAIKNGFKPVSLGDTRLRTETAALVAAVLLSN